MIIIFIIIGTISHTVTASARFSTFSVRSGANYFDDIQVECTVLLHDINPSFSWAMDIIAIQHNFQKVFWPF